MQSHLAIHDLATGRSETILSVGRRIEAPNWLPDGSGLLVNGDGRLFRVPLDAPALVAAETGGLARLNNDHAPSPDGRWIAVSDKTETGKSCIYTVPAAGRPARRITREVPSWFHGWSPDGARMTYAAIRGGAFCIATNAAEGGDERIVIGGPGHYDGPDFDAAGARIWFNSDRDGSMQIWRVRIDGTEAERMTGDDRVNWFPHPAPDGGRVVYLSYPPGTEGHPADLPVELRLIDLAGGAVRVIETLRGGQGTLNVPCWAPEGRRFAFLRYEA